MTIAIEIEHEAWRDIAGFDVLAMRAATLATDEIPGEIVLVLAGDSEVQILNREWRGHDKPTNVLSFPANPDMPLPDGAEPLLGDVIIAYETAAREAAEQSKSVSDHATHLIVHGILHLLGYDHDTEPEAEAMAARERAILASLGIKDPYEI